MTQRLEGNDGSRGASRTPPRAVAGDHSEWSMLDCHPLVWALMQKLVATPEWLLAMSPAVM